ncbi:MAG: ABC transporter permease [Azospirillum sp.]|nr:ABC transporter permease [Azospirillum sp.]MCA3267978.1 ABC transporter permease [Azospirillum sp.]
MSAIALPLLRQAALICAIVIAVFFLIRVVPGDVVDVLALEGDLAEAEVAQIRAELGLDRPAHEQFLRWLARASQGDLGLSLRFERPVVDMIGFAVPATLSLAAQSLAIGLALGVALATLSAIWPRSPFAWLVEAVNVWSIAIPTFCVGLAAILVFSIWLGWMPVLGNTLVPAIVIGIDVAGQIVKPLHEELKETATAPFVRAARGRGESRAQIVFARLLPNAAPVAIALSGLILTGLIGGTLTMEVLFGLPGLGTLALQAIQGRDYPVVQAVILLFAVSIVTVNTATDLCQRLIDPRLRR